MDYRNLENLNKGCTGEKRGEKTSLGMSLSDRNSLQEAEEKDHF